MSQRPKLSLCIPTWNRARYLRGALESGLREAANQAPGVVEVLVCDNASSDHTQDVISQVHSEYPELRSFRNTENIGFDLNYLRCVEEAHGEFVWVLGDDDEWLPGSLTRVMQELERGADACLCLAEACDLDFNPVVVMPWYLDPNPPTQWCLETREDLIRYFDGCARNAGVFGFISVTVFRRDCFLQHRESLQQVIGMGYIHLRGMMKSLLHPINLHYIPEVLVRNRLNGDATNGGTDFYGRWMLDLRAWGAIADEIFGNDPELDGAFSRIVGRNHHNTILPGLRKHAPDEAAWLDAKPYLVRAGFSPVRIAAVDFSYQHVFGDRLPMPTLNSTSLCLVDVALVARGARRIAILALGGLPNILGGAGLLAALRNGGLDRVRIFCPAECAEILDGFSLQCVDSRRYAGDEAYRKSIAQSMIDFNPELAINLDPDRGIEADDLVNAALPAAAVAFELPERGQEAKLIHAANVAYSCLVPGVAGSNAMLKPLGMEGTLPSIWPSAGSQEEAKAVLANLGWDPTRTLAVLVDHFSILEDPAFKSAFAEAVKAGWTFVGIGGRGTYQSLEFILDPLEGRAANFAGVLNLASMASLLKICGGFLGGSPLFQSLARVCGCAPIPNQY